MQSLRYTLVLVLLLLIQGVEASEAQDSPGAVMATRGQGSVTAEEFDARISKIPEKDRARFLRDPSRVNTILGNLLLNSQVVADARANKFGEGDEQLQLRLKMAAEQELANAWLEHITYSQPVADYTALAREYYLANQDKFGTGPAIDVTHLLISTQIHTVEEAESLAQGYLEQTLSDPSLFDELVVTYSEDSSVASNDGHFTAVKKGVMVKPFEEAAFNLKNVGDFTGLVRTQFGFHIIRLDGKHPSKLRPFEDVRVQMESRMASEHRDRIRETYLRELTSLETNISEEEIKAMVKRHFPADVLQLESDSSNNE